MAASHTAGASAFRWQFVDQDPGGASGVFRAWNAHELHRLYFPLVNEAGMFSWTTPRLQGGPAISHHAHLSVPLTAEDLPHSLLHRDFWVVEPGRTPFSLAGYASNAGAPRVDAGPGWFSLTRRSADGRFAVRGTLWCPADLPDPLELFWIEIESRSRATLRVTPYAAIPLFARSADNIRDHRHVTVLLHRTRHLRHGVAVHPTMTFDERGHTLNRLRYAVLAFGPRGRAPQGVWSNEAQFLGEGGSFAAPRAVWARERTAPRERRTVPGQEAIGGFRFAPVTLPPGGRAGYLLISGITADLRRLERWQRWARRPARWAASLQATQSAWQAKTRQVSFATADRTLDHWLSWVSLQPHLRRLYGNSYLPQFDYGRGGRGWRDLWQDCLAWLLSAPEAVRPMLLHHVGGVRIDGSNATIIGQDGGFIADRNNIPRTWMDHGAWPAYTMLRYVDQTGDLDLLLQRREYFRDPQRFRCRRQDPAWSARDGFVLRTRGGAVYRGSVLEHLLVQHLTAFFNVGAHHLCRLEGADWNDGLDMAPHRGESAAFSALYAWNLKRLAQTIAALAARGLRRVPLCEELGLLLDRLPGQPRVDYGSAAAKQRRLEAYLTRVFRSVSGRTMEVDAAALIRDLLAKHEDLAGRIRRQEWVRTREGSWFNGYYDDLGRRVEGAARRGVRMTLTGQVFTLMSGLATEGQVDAVIRSVRRLLRDPHFGGIRLNTDFRELQPHLGRAFSFAYGEKENGAVFSHMAVMYAFALYARRRPEEGRRVWHALFRMATDQPTAKIFPCLPEYFNAEGRGMYGYLTGSASWLVHLLATQVFGVRGELGDLVIDPQLTKEDFGRHRQLSVSLPFAGRRLEVVCSAPRRRIRGPYRVAAVRDERGAGVVCERLPGGGVRIARRVVAALPADRRTTWRVRLS